MALPNSMARIMKVLYSSPVSSLSPCASILAGSELSQFEMGQLPLSRKRGIHLCLKTDSRDVD
jgi:hypothetical protein